MEKESNESDNKVNNNLRTIVLSSNRREGRQRMSDPKTLLTYTKFFLFIAYIVFMGGRILIVNELIRFLIGDDYVTSSWITAIALLVLGAISFGGLWAAFKEDSCLLIVNGIIISVVFVGHVVLLFYLKNACVTTRDKCYRNMSTPPGVAPILMAITELAIAICTFFMVVVIEAEKRRQNEHIFDLT